MTDIECFYSIYDVYEFVDPNLFHKSIQILIANTNTDPLPLFNVFLIASNAFDASFASLISIAAVTVDPDDICSVTFLIFMPTNLLANVMPVTLSSLMLMNAHLIDPL